jgi:hypothetical protein
MPLEINDKARKRVFEFLIKQKKIFSFLLTLSIILIPVASFALNALIDLSLLTYDTHHFWNKHGDKKNSYNHFRKTEYDIYLELNADVCGIFSIEDSFSSIHDRLDGNTNGFGDIQAHWTFQPFPRNLTHLWLNLTTVIPAGKEKDSLRYGRWAFEGDLHYSNAKKIGHIPFWYDFGLGYRLYSGFPSDQIRAIINTAAALSSNFYLYGIGNAEWGLFNGRRQEHYNQILFNPNYRLIKVQIGLVGYITDWMYLDAGYYQFIWGENIGMGGGFIGSFGLSY